MKNRFEFILLTAFLCFGSAGQAQSVCYITLPVCPGVPELAGATLPDNYAGASSNPQECMQRGSDYFGACGGQAAMGGQVTAANFYSNGALTGHSVWGSSCYITLPACPNDPQLVGTFLDNYNNASGDVNECRQRASDYYGWCGGGTLDWKVVTASFYQNGQYTTSAQAGQARLSSYSQIPSDTAIVSDATVAQINVFNNLPVSRKVLLESDGRWYVTWGGPLAIAGIYVDGVAVGNQAVMDWNGSLIVEQHSFNIIATLALSPGAHKIELRALGSQRGAYAIGGGTNLSVLESSAATIQIGALAADTGVISNPNAPKQVILTNLIGLPSPVRGPAAILSSGRVYSAGSAGDAMTGISLNSVNCPNAGDQSWAVNDMGPQAELQAPIFNHGFYNSNGMITPTFFGSVFPWLHQTSPNPVQFRVGGGTTMISIERAAVMGTGTSRSFVNHACDTEAYLAIPTNGSRAQLASSVINIPAGHDGVVEILAKTRMQANPNDNGNMFIGLTVDGVDVGSVGVQGIGAPHGDSQRTVSTSYLADASHPLGAGAHTVVVWVSVQGSFAAAYANQDLTLLYFD